MALFPSAPGGGQEVAHGYKGKGVLLHVITDSHGFPLAIHSTGANGDERVAASGLLARLRAEKLAKKFAFVEADKGYDSAKLRAEMVEQKYFPLIAWRKCKSSEQRRPTTRGMLDLLRGKSQRWKIERFFSHIKRRYRRLLARWERLQTSWMSFCKLALIAFWVF